MRLKPIHLATRVCIDDHGTHHEWSLPAAAGLVRDVCAILVSSMAQINMRFMDGEPLPELVVDLCCRPSFVGRPVVTRVGVTISALKPAPISALSSASALRTAAKSVNGVSPISFRAAFPAGFRTIVAWRGSFEASLTAPN